MGGSRATRELRRRYLVIPALLPYILGINKVIHRRCKELLSNLQRGPGVSTVVLDTSADDIPNGVDMTGEFSSSKTCRVLAEDLSISKMEERCVYPFFK
jgi:hypothetical protein